MSSDETNSDTADVLQWQRMADATPSVSDSKGSHAQVTHESKAVIVSYVRVVTVSDIDILITFQILTYATRLGTQPELPDCGDPILQHRRSLLESTSCRHECLQYG